MFNKEIAYFPEIPTENLAPQLLGVFYEGMFYHLAIETFHLYQSVNYGKICCEHKHDVFHAVFYISGRNQIKCASRLIPCSPGSLVLTSPEMIHSFAPYKHGNVVYHELTFSLRNGNKKLPVSFETMFQLLFGGNAEARAFPLCFKDSIAELEKHYLELGSAVSAFSVHDPFPSYRQVYALLEYIYMKGFSPRECHKQHSMHTQSAPKNLLAAKQLLEQNLSTKITLSATAAKAGLSPEHFCREFKRHFGDSPVIYRLKQRVKAAERMLLYSDLPLKEIAAKQGFSDEYYFSKMFKKISGKTPGTLRRERN